MLMKQKFFSVTGYPVISPQSCFASALDLMPFVPVYLPTLRLMFPKHGGRLTLCFAYDINGITLLLLHNWYCRYLSVPFVLIGGTASLLLCARFWVVFCFLTVTVLTLTPSFPVGGRLPFRPVALSSTATWSTQPHQSLPHTEQGEGRKLL